MRHRYSGRKLNKTGTHKRAMFRNMTASLVEHELIKTTLPKAKDFKGISKIKASGVCGTFKIFAIMVTPSSSSTTAMA